MYEFSRHFRICWRPAVIACLGVSLFATCALGATDPLDRPILCQNREMLYAAVRNTRGQIWELDFSYAYMACERLGQWLIKSGVSQTEADQFVLSLVNGKTPRQIIQAGAALMVFEGKLGPVLWAEGIKGDARRQEAQKGDFDSLNSIGQNLLAKYPLGKSAPPGASK